MQRSSAMVALAVALMALAGCGPPELSEAERKAIAALSLAALPPLPADPSNGVADDPDAAALGEALFHDTGLSDDGNVSCATCHIPERQFQDDLARAQGAGMTDRRTMPLEGVAWSPWQFWDGRRDSLWSQALTPLEDAREHAGDRTSLARFVAERHRTGYERVFGPLPDLGWLPEDAASPRGDAQARARWDALPEARRGDIDAVFANIGKAIAAFERTLRPRAARFDRFAAAIAEGREPEGEDALTPIEIEGLRLFIGEGNCIECHNGPRFTDDFFHNTGVPPVEGLPPDRGRAGAIAELLADPFNCLGPHSDAPPDACAELRFMRRDGHELERAFKTPSLRGVADRAPYMHSGQFATLDEVLHHYSSAPKRPAGAGELRPIALTDRGRAALVAFLRTLDK